MDCRFGASEGGPPAHSAHDDRNDLIDNRSVGEDDNERGDDDTGGYGRVRGRVQERAFDVDVPGTFFQE